MKRIISLLFAAMIMATSFGLSAQSLVGKWNSTPGSQKAMLEAIGAQFKETRVTQTFNDDSTYEIYAYLKIDMNIQGLQMSMFVEYIESGTWQYSDGTLTYASNNYDFKNLEISFDDPTLNAFREDVIATMKSAFEQSKGIEISYDVEFFNENEVRLTTNSEFIPNSYVFTITRIE
ncbi:MAG: hypothetical protein J6U91_00805 [Alistipes sp.]|nr:hypothetical protein [Alistipes sp.]